MYTCKRALVDPFVVLDAGSDVASVDECQIRDGPGVTLEALRAPKPAQAEHRQEHGEEVGAPHDHGVGHPRMSGHS